MFQSPVWPPPPFHHGEQGDSNGGRVRESASAQELPDRDILQEQVQNGEGRTLQAQGGKGMQYC